MSAVQALAPFDSGLQLAPAPERDTASRSPKALVQPANAQLVSGGEPATCSMSSPAISTLYQPITSLERREVVGFHAFVGAAGNSDGSQTDAVRALAHDAGCTAAWDWRYRAAAFEDALDADLPAALSVFVGIEPETLDVACPDALAALVAKAEAQLRVFVEFDGPTLLANPSGLLATIARAREARWGIALRALAEHPASTAMLRLVCPDVVIFDLRRLRTLEQPMAARVVNECLTYCQQSGASLLVRGVDTTADVNQALGWRTDFVEGKHFGSSIGTLQPTKPPRRAIPLISTAAPVVADDPFEAISSVGDVLRSPPRHLAMLTRTLEQRCLTVRQSAVVLSCQHRTLFSADGAVGASGWFDAHTSFVAMLGVRPPADIAGKVVRVRLARQDPLVQQRILTIVSDNFFVALAARRTDAGSYDDRLDVALSYDVGTVTDVARTLLTRIPAVPIDGNRILKAVAPPRTPPAVERASSADGVTTPNSVRWLRRWRA